VKCLTNKIRVLLVVILTTLSLAATAQERVALVIGNSNYVVSPLANTLNDAQDIAETLKELDFSVTTVIDGNRTEMIKAIRAFGKSLDKKTIALFYYAGHGVNTMVRTILSLSVHCQRSLSVVILRTRR